MSLSDTWSLAKTVRKIQFKLLQLSLGVVVLQQPLPVRVVSPVERAVALGEQLPEALVGLVPRFKSLPLRDGRLPWWR